MKFIYMAILFISQIFLLSCGNIKDTGTDSPETNTTDSSSESIEIIHNGTTYDFVISPYTGKVWLDRNLGAARVCEVYDDVACYGDYYQWGRNYDGHQDEMSETSGTQAVSLDNTSKDFIVSKHNFDYDWAYGIDIQGIKRNENWSKIDGSSICPAGYRVPSINELEAELIHDDVNSSSSVYKNFLKLPLAGYREYEQGLVVNNGEYGAVWANNISNSPQYTAFLSFGNQSVRSGYDHRAFGFSVRCIKD